MFTELSEYALEFTGRPFYPSCIHIDNEATIINLIETSFPLTEIRKCILYPLFTLLLISRP